MRYKLMVFEPGAAPADHPGFTAWYARQMRWSEGHSYADVAITSHRLRLWLAAMQQDFPALVPSTPRSASLLEDEAATADWSEYFFARQFILAEFAWTEANAACKLGRALAQQHGLSLFEASSLKRELWRMQGDQVVLQQPVAALFPLQRIRRLLLHRYFLKR